MPGTTAAPPTRMFHRLAQVRLISARRLRCSALPGVAIAILIDRRKLIRGGALVAISSSGGKDSQAMTILLSRIVPRDQLVVVHAPLGEVDWPGTITHIEVTIPVGVPFILAPVTSSKTLLDRIEERGLFPSNSARWCTSDAKRSPIERELRRYLKAHPRFGGLVVSAMGMRAAENPAHSKRAPWKRNSRNSKAGREWFDWLPIHALETPDVFRIIREAGQAQHWAYAAGMPRVSCSFCILASRADLRRVAELRPDLYARYAASEQRIGHTLSPSRKPLPELTGKAARALPRSSSLLALRRPARPCRAGNSDTNLVVRTPAHRHAGSTTPCRR